MLKGKPIGKRLFGRPGHKLEDSIRMELKEIDINTRNWVNSAQDRDCWRASVNAVFKFHFS